MYDEKEIEDSLEFCKDIQIYYEADKRSPFYDYTKVHKRTKIDVFRENEYAYQTMESIARDQLSGQETESSVWFLRDLLNIIICIAAAFVLATLITNIVAHHTRVEGASMEPTLAENDYLIIEKISYYFHDPRRYDIIVFPVAVDSDTDGNYYIKRIIGMPGETIQIKNGSVYINGDLLGEEYGMAEILDMGIAEKPVTLGEDEYFVLGDNRNLSTDSRSSNIGAIKKEDIVGRACLRIYPFRKFGALD